jgi:hypothetical protein
MAKRKKPNNDLQNTTQKIKLKTRIPLKAVGRGRGLGATQEIAVPAPLVTPAV